MELLKTSFLALLFALFAGAAIAGSVDGKVTDEDGGAVPFVTVYIEGTTIGTTTNSEGNFHLDLKDGFHTIVFRYVGYKTEIRGVTVSGKTDLNVVLNRVVFQLGEAQVDGNEDPAYRIMRLARSRRKFYQQQVREYSCKVYVKGVNSVKNLPKRILGQSLDISGLDETRSGIVYLSESLSEYHFKAPDKTKERVIASKVSGNSQGFTWNNATSLNFNFYDRTYNLQGLSDRDLVSPLSPSANMYYRYVYRGFYVEDSIIVNKIELIPKVKGVPLFNGYIFIQENTWRIHGAELFMTSEAGIDFVDTIRMKVDFIPLSKDLWMKGNLSFDFAFNVKLFKVKGWGTFSSVFSDYSIREYARDTTLIARYAKIEEPTEEEEGSDEVIKGQAVASIGDSATVFDFDSWKNGPMLKVESEANEKDEAFWEQIRTVPLTELERKDYQRKDSIEVVKESKVYKDSIDDKNNKFALRNLLYGYKYQNSTKNYSIDFQSPFTAVHYNTVEGYLIDYKVEFSTLNKDKGSNLSVAWNNRYGFYSNRYYSKARIFYRFNRMNRMSIRAEGGRYVEQFNQGAVGDAINSLYSVLLEENYMKLQEHSYADVAWGVEAFNGFRLNVSGYYGQRRTLNNATNLDGTYVDYKTKYFSLNEPGNESNGFNDPVFGDNNAIVIGLGFVYQPGMKYMERPNGKINLGTIWPEFTFRYEKGLGGFGKLDADFDLLKLKITDEHSFGLVGRFEWEANAGWFANNNFVPFMNWQHFNTSQVHVMSSGLGRFMALPYYAASTNKYFVQAHIEHHFNGFIMNKIPLIKKLKWQVVGGVHYLYEPTYGNYWEVTAGIENIFKIIRVDFVAPFRESNVQNFAFRFQLGF
ncbi:MAG: DUF5686 and carboxypeptidase regulatory-like domain-containing protein [Flavobacteriales bacterium]|nr:DUF5686 and carboxypeptidase regulatory-like domain-containing protein [Flavobacteriales bacterium]